MPAPRPVQGAVTAVLLLGLVAHWWPVVPLAALVLVVTLARRPPAPAAADVVFRGTVGELRPLLFREGPRFTFQGGGDRLRPGDAVAVNGCRLAVADVGGGSCHVDIDDQTLAGTNLADLQPGDIANVALPIGREGPLPGDVLRGRVDAVGEVQEWTPHLRVRAPRRVIGRLAPDGLIAVDGCSVRIIDVLDDGFTVALPPAAAEVTARTPRQPGIRVNLELLREPRSPTRERLTSVAATILLAGSLLVFAVGASWWAWAIVVAAAFVSGLAAVADVWVRPIRPRSLRYVRRPE